MNSIQYRGIPSAHHDRLAITSAAALLVLTLHLLVFMPLVLGPSGSATARGGIHSGDAPASATPLVLAVQVQRSQSESRLARLQGTLAIHSVAEASRAAVRQPSFLVAPSVLLPEQAAEQELPDPVPAAVRRIGEITARLQAAWVLPPRSATTNFRCRVRIRQDEAGALSGIELQHCDDDPELRASLIAAVRAASPLPTRDNLEHSGWDLTLEFKSSATSPTGRRSSVEPSASVP